jgi:acetate kinase
LSSFLLIFNAGSSSVKFSLFETGADTDLHLRWRGQIEGFGGSPSFEVFEDGQRIASQPFTIPENESPHRHAFKALFGWLFGMIEPQALLAAGHRVVHGGGVFTTPVLIDAQTLERMTSFNALAPLHQPHNIAGIEAVARLLPDLPQAACFDTAFHATMPEPAYTLALPADIRAMGLRRYGFHGLSYENVAQVLPRQFVQGQARVVVAHLGNGASLCAMRGGRCIDTTMSFTALDGLIMGTRGGVLDPGVLLHLMRAGASLEDLEILLYKHSGLLGLSGETNDMRALLESGSAGARLAVECFIYRAVREIGAMVAALGGLDALVFTGGIGERSDEIRSRISAGLGWLGLSLDPQANERHALRIEDAASQFAVFIIPANEEGVIARHTLDLVRSSRTIVPARRKDRMRKNAKRSRSR